MNKKGLIRLVCAFCMTVFGVSMLNAQEKVEDYDAEYGKELLDPGTKAPAIELKTNDGEVFRLSSLKGRYVVLDFWASWCPDCRKEIPDVKRLYKKYGSKEVRFVGVSFDDKEQQWHDAIEKFQMEYIQVSELKRMKNSEVAKAYGIKWIPSMYLIGPDGKVILSTVMLSKMEKALEDLPLKTKSSR